MKEQDKGNAKRLENQEKAACPAPVSKIELLQRTAIAVSGSTHTGKNN